MANINNPTGAIIIGSFASQERKLNKYVIPASDSTPLYVGDFVSTTGVSNADGIPICQKETNGNAIRGIVESFVALNMQPEQNRIYRAANEERFVNVCDDAWVYFSIQVNTTLTTTDFGKNANITVGTPSNITGLSGTTLDLSTLTLSSAQLKLLALIENEDNELGLYSRVICMIHDHELQHTSTGLGTEFLDSVFRVLNSSDPTKKISFDASLISAGTTRQYGWQDKNGTVALMGDNGTGFALRTNNSITYDSSAVPVTISCFPLVSSFDYYLSGVKYTVTSASPLNSTHAPVRGVYYFYVDATNTLICDQNTPDLLTDMYIGEVVFDSAGTAFVIDKRYLYTDSSVTRKFINTLGGGAYVLSGFDISDYTVQPAVPVNADNQFSFAQGIVKDNDIEKTLVNLVGGIGPYIPFYRGAANAWQIGSLNTFPFPTSENIITYNQNLGGGNWQLTQVGDVRYVNYYYVAVPVIYGVVYRFLVIPGQKTYATSSEAYQENITDLNVSGEFLPTFAPLYKITYFRSVGYTTVGQCSIQKVTDLRSLTQLDVTDPKHYDTRPTEVIYIGDKDTDGSYRLLRDTNSVILQELIAGTWTDSQLKVSGTGLQVGSSVPFSDSSGTLTMQNIDALDATTVTTILQAVHYNPYPRAIYSYVGNTGTFGGNKVADTNWVQAGGAGTQPTAGTTIVTKQWFRYPFNTAVEEQSWCTVTLQLINGNGANCSSFLLDSGTYEVQIITNHLYTSQNGMALSTDSATLKATALDAIISSDVNTYGGFSNDPGDTQCWLEDVITLATQTRVYVHKNIQNVNANYALGYARNCVGLTEEFARITFTKIS